MMYKLKFVFAFVLLQASTCKKEELDIKVPDCIVEKIKSLKADDVSNPPASVYQYEYNGKTVYYIPAKCCDFPSLLIDENCQTICSPDGGFTGNGDGKCSDFFKNRSKEKLIWKDDRS